MRIAEMSKFIFTIILSEILSKKGINVSLSESERDQLYMELLRYFGLIGGLNICESLERAWQDPYNRSEIEKFIISWIRRKMRKSLPGEYQPGVI